MFARFWRSIRILVIVVLALAGFSSALLAASASKMAPGDRERVAQAVSQVGTVVAGQPVEPSGKATPPTATGEIITHSAPGVSLSAPDTWEVTPSDDDIFTLGLPGKFVFGFLGEESVDEFPGLFAIILFEQQSDLLATSMGEDVAIYDLARFETDQGMPGLNIQLGGNIDGLDMAGSMYIVAAGDATYMLMVLSTEDEWAEIQADADGIAASIAADNPSVMISGGAKGRAFTTADGVTSLFLPPQWQIQEMDDPDVSVMLVNPEMTFVAAGLWEPVDAITDTTDLALYNALISAVAGSTQESTVMDLLIQSMDLGSGEDDVQFDKAATALLTATDPPTLRLGATLVNDEMSMPMMAYVQAQEEGIVGFMTMGNIDDVLDAEEIILAILGSVVLGK